MRGTPLERLEEQAVFDTRNLGFHMYSVSLVCLLHQQPIRKSAEEGMLHYKVLFRPAEDMQLGLKAEGRHRQQEEDIDSWAVVLGRAAGCCLVDTADLST